MRPPAPAITTPAAAAALLLLLAGPAAAQEPGAVPSHVGSAACAACHDAEAADWEGSHHALAWTEPSPETVRADFDGTEFSHAGMTARFRIGPEGGYHVSVTETDGGTTEYEVHSVVGVEPLQQYLLETEAGRLQSFDVVWDTEREAWFHLYPDDDLPPDDALHWTGPYKTWNARCAECHATGFEKRYDPGTGRYASRQAEIGVGCEACHGPGSEHLRWAEGLEAASGGAELDAYGFSQSFATTEATVQQCATCHSRREAHGDASPLPGTPYHDSYGLALLRPGLYHADGQIRDEVFVYGSFLQSRMAAAGVGCLDCHEAHGAGLVAEGNGLCTRCHAPEGGDPGFAAAAGLYDDPSHHFHEPGSEGAQCRSCHMPEEVYMGVDWRADHSFRVPRPDLAPTTGAPDACTACHTDRGPGWAAEEIAARFPDSAHRGPHYGEVLVRGRADPAGTAGALATLAEDGTQAGIVRATALWLLRNAGDTGLGARLEPLLGDPDPLVRAAAVSAQAAAPPMERVPRVVGALDDPSRSVRIEAAEAMIGAPIARMPDGIRSDFEHAAGESQAAYASRLDFPETHLQLAGLALTMRNLGAAAEAFRTALALDPQRGEAWSMLVRIAAATEGAEAARAVLAEALARLPDDIGLLRMDAELSGAPFAPSLLPPPAEGPPDAE